MGSIPESIQQAVCHTLQLGENFDKTMSFRRQTLICELRRHWILRPISPLEYENFEFLFPSQRLM